MPRLARAALAAWSDDRAPSMGAALAYYTLFSIAPLLLIVIAVAGAVFGTDAAEGEIFRQLQGLLGSEGATAIQGLLAGVRERDQSGWGAALGGVLLVVGATTVFAELQQSLDRIWRVPRNPQRPGWWTLVRARLLAFGVILGVGFLLMVSLVVSAALAAWGRWWAPVLSNWPWVLQTVNALVGLALTVAMFALLYKLIPSVPVAWGDVWHGAFVTAVLFTLGKTLIALYIGKSAVASGFGAAGSLVAMLVWVYWSAQVFFVGAEFTRLMSEHRRGEGAAAAAEATAGAAPPQAAAAVANPVVH
ncbi:MAG: YihY/virulence factor BrkB family protein [Rubrivivax sp.]|nr:YihY/virulence factor BrkB family protein [Rubrivivax sp.]